MQTDFRTAARGGRHQFYFTERLGHIMKENNRNRNENRDIIERYCPRRGENVVMTRTCGEHPHTECMDYSSCPYEKDRLCGRGIGSV